MLEARSWRLEEKEREDFPCLEPRKTRKGRSPMQPPFYIRFFLQMLFLGRNNFNDYTTVIKTFLRKLVLELRHLGVFP